MDEFRQAFGRLSKYEKLSALLLAVFGVAAVFLGVTQMKANVYYGSDRGQQKIEKNVSNLKALSPEEGLRAADTDADGLSDFDEINIYKSSPYLSDSDSDGESDAQEVAAGGNPNCPKGDVCLGANTSGSGGEFAAPSNNDLETPVGQLNNDLVNLFGYGESFDVEKLREGLIQSGVDPAAVEGVTDDQLRQLYEETLGSTGVIAPGAATATTPDPEVADLDEFKQVLIDSGVDAAQVNALSKEQLQELLQEALKQAEEVQE